MNTLPRNKKRAFALIAACAVGLTWLAGCGTHIEPTASADPVQPMGKAKAATRKAAAAYNDDGALLLPDNHREWVFVGAPVTPNDMNEGHAAFPEFHNVYLDPASFATYKQTGEFPDGAMIVKELVSVGGKSMPSGRGYFQGEFVSLEAMVKDTRRFPEEPGGWAFFRFGEAPDYQPIAARMKTTDCNTCHSGATEDYVFTSTYPVLRAARPRAAE
jgi:hypothetical protein